MTAAARPWYPWILVSLLALVPSLIFQGCGQNSRTQITSPFFFDSSGQFHQVDIEGRWSGTLSFGSSAYTVTFLLGPSGLIEEGLESDGDDITEGYVFLTNVQYGNVDIEYRTDTGVIVNAVGSIEIGNERIFASFVSSEGYQGKLSLRRVPGPGFVNVNFIQGEYDVEFANFLYDVRFDGYVDIIFSGYLRIGTPIGNSTVQNGQIFVLDSVTGRFNGTIILLNGEIIFVTGIISYADGILAGTYLNEGDDERLVTFFPR